MLSALGNGSAFALATAEKIDLVVIGHCAPVGIRENAANYFKDHFPDIPAVALRSDSLSDKVKFADYNSTAEDPEEWLNVVAQAASQSGHYEDHSGTSKAG